MRAGFRAISCGADLGPTADEIGRSGPPSRPVLRADTRIERPPWSAQGHSPLAFPSCPTYLPPVTGNTMTLHGPNEPGWDDIDRPGIVGHASDKRSVPFLRWHLQPTERAVWLTTVWTWQWERCYERSVHLLRNRCWPRSGKCGIRRRSDHVLHDIAANATGRMPSDPKGAY